QVMAERAAAELQRGEGPPNARWLAAWRQGTKTMKDLALRLRLSPQSRREKAKVERPLTWDERFRLERFCPPLRSRPWPCSSTFAATRDYDILPSGSRRAPQGRSQRLPCEGHERRPRQQAPIPSRRRWVRDTGSFSIHGCPKKTIPEWVDGL